METVYLAAICAVVPGLGRRRLPALLQRLGGAKNVFEASSDDLKAAGVCMPQAIDKFVYHRDKSLPEKLQLFCERQKIQLISIYDKAYPESLRMIADPPLVLYVKGSLPKEEYNFAVVGARACTEYGVRAASYFSKALTHDGIPIISGGAKGIDTAAHKACIDAGGKTVAVFGCGIDIAYPAENRKLFAKIAEQGALVSEFAPGMQPLPSNFPARNRIIVGLSQGVLVAEASIRSGAVITANIAADEGRDVYCVPGNIFDGNSEGCHELIRTGAKLVDNVNHILEDKYSWQKLMKNYVSQPSIFDIMQEEKKPAPIQTETKLGEKLLKLLQAGAMPLEYLTEQSGESFAAVSMELLDLQVAGLVAVDKAQRYYRK